MRAEQGRAWELKRASGVRGAEVLNRTSEDSGNQSEEAWELNEPAEMNELGGWMGLEGEERLKMGLRHQGSRTGLAEEEQARRVGRRTCLCGIQGSAIDMAAGSSTGTLEECA